MKKLIAVLIGLIAVPVFLLTLSDEAQMIAAHDTPQDREVATFAAGCFWCTESLFQELEGVDSVISGYAGGEFPDPTYKEVISQKTDHREAVQIVYDPEVVDYKELTRLMLESIDPADAGGQFVDRGFSYTAAIFYHDGEQKNIAEDSIGNLELNEKIAGQPIATKVLPYSTFYIAEEYHQDFYLKSPGRYNSYTDFSGRKEFKEFVWGEIQNGRDQFE